MENENEKVKMMLTLIENQEKINYTFFVTAIFALFREPTTNHLMLVLHRRMEKEFKLPNILHFFKSPDMPCP